MSGPVRCRAVARVRSRPAVRAFLPSVTMPRRREIGAVRTLPVNEDLTPGQHPSRHRPARPRFCARSRRAQGSNADGLLSRIRRHLRIKSLLAYHDAPCEVVCLSYQAPPILEVWKCASFLDLKFAILRWPAPPQRAAG
jgi:hypothetical protein